MSRARPNLRRFVLVATTLCLLVGGTGTASAGHETLSRSVGNLTQGPLDVALSPVVAWRTVTTRVRDIDDTTAVRIFYFLPGYVWMTGVQVGAGVLRVVTGALELLPGIFLLPFKDTELDPMFDPVERGEALVEYENPVMDIKFGINYQTPAY